MAGVFISYSRQDEEFAQRLYEVLRKERTAVFVDLEGIAPSKSWEREIEAAIEEADAFIFVVSPESIQSKWCLLELETAFRLQKRIISILVREVPHDSMPPLLAYRQMIDFRRADNLDEALHLLLRVLEVTGVRRGPLAKPSLNTSELKSLTLSRRWVVIWWIVALVTILTALCSTLVTQLGLLANSAASWPTGVAFSQARQFLIHHVVGDPFLWFGLSGANLLFNIVMTTGFVMMWRRGRALAAQAAQTAASPGMVFISYSRTDGEFVDKLEGDLGKEHFKTWVDRRNLKGGQVFDRKIKEALNECQLALVVLSPNALKSGWVRKEYRYAMRRGKTVVPILFHPCPSIPKALSRFHQLDFQAGLNFEAKYRYALVELLAALDDVPVARMAETAA